MITPIPARCSYSKSAPSKLILYHDVLGGRQDVTGLTDDGVAAKWCEVYSRTLFGLLQDLAECTGVLSQPEVVGSIPYYPAHH